MIEKWQQKNTTLFSLLYAFWYSMCQTTASKKKKKTFKNIIENISSVLSKNLNVLSRFSYPGDSIKH